MRSTRSPTISARHGRWVEHSMRFKDQMQVGAAGRARLKLVENKD
jgi:hypothetical protein